MPQGPEPIAYVGHGAMFDTNGEQILPTESWFSNAQAWYRAMLWNELDAQGRTEFATFDSQLRAGLSLKGQAEQVLEQRAIDWLAEHAQRRRGDVRLASKLSAMRYQLKWKHPVLQAGAAALPGLWEGGPFELEDPLMQRLSLPNFRADGILLLATTNSGQAYIDECKANQVPIPPTINKMDPNGTAGWKSQGWIPKGEQFIVNTPAEVRTFESAEGMCIALPRYSDDNKTTVALDGVICLSKITSKVCFWDNQMSTVAFAFPATQEIPIGVPDTSVDPSGRYQAGGAELEGGQGGICTDCHAGENPYVVHPETQLSPALKFGGLRSILPMFTPDRYIPLVPASWPQNDASHAEAFVPTSCSACHKKGIQGRFPHLSNALPGYCFEVLKPSLEGLNAIPATMPQGAPGTLATDADVIAFQSFCNGPPDSNAADWGDPHLTTVNGIHYDFQSAGEFIALRNADGDFELQTRQTPVTTTFVPAANPYTGLQSCVSLITAAAVRLGGRRVSYQLGKEGRMQLRVDGELTSLPAGGIDLDGGNRVTAVAGGDGIDVTAADGTRVLITSHFWSSQGYWHLNIEVFETPAREGLMGFILPDAWLPPAPDGSSFGPKPGPIADRHDVLNHKFADAWRVTGDSSLFDYAAGSSTATFTDKAWPPAPGSACTESKVEGPGPVSKPVERERAEQLCRGSAADPALHAACVFDVMVMGETDVAKAYRRTAEVREAAGLPLPESDAGDAAVDPP